MNTVSAYEPTITQRIRWKLQTVKHRTAVLWRSLCDRAKWLGHKPGNLERYAESELRRAGMFDKDSSYGGMLGTAVLRMVREFSDEGHSGFSAGMARHLFEKVSAFQPLQPLTGADDEWQEVGNGVFQNVRCSRVFKDETGAYDIDGRVFREPGCGACYTNRESRVYVTFPYTPTTEYVDFQDATP